MWLVKYEIMSYVVYESADGKQALCLYKMIGVHLIGKMCKYILQMCIM